MSWWDHEDRISRLKEAWKSGRTAADIGEDMGRSRHAVLAKIDRLRKEGGPDAPARRDGEGPAGLKASAKRAQARSQRNPPKSSPFTSTWGGGNKPVAVEPYVEKVVEAVPATAVTVVDVEAHHCRWPVGKAPWLFCGANKVKGLPYCDRHAKRAYAPPVPNPSPIMSDATGGRIAQDGQIEVFGVDVAKKVDPAAGEAAAPVLEMEGAE